MPRLVFNISLEDVLQWDNAGKRDSRLTFVTYLLYLLELGHVLHPCEGDLVCKCTNEKIPYFNAPVYLENKSQIGKVDDIFGPMTDFVSLVECKDNILYTQCCY